MDLGQQIDPNLVEALCYEVLEEKISSMIFNKEPGFVFEPQSHLLRSSSNAQPKPNSQQILDSVEQHRPNRPIDNQVHTPTVTPAHSRPTSPSVTSNQLSRLKDNIQQTDLGQFVNFGLFTNDEEDSILEVSIEEPSHIKAGKLLRKHKHNENFNVVFQIFFFQKKKAQEENSIFVPPTPRETPPPLSPSPKTPEISEVIASKSFS